MDRVSTPRNVRIGQGALVSIPRSGWIVFQLPAIAGPAGANGFNPSFGMDRVSTM